ncbi:MAG TPA: hypothetical protein VLQ89_09215 [Candidatus Binatia bacterium]|nr:hypothetical protein [Candidatus Binatia bacterium]
MKKLNLVLVFFILAATLLAGADKFFVSAGAALALPSDSRYRDFYGTVQFSPELTVGYRFFKSFYAWLGYHFFSASYAVPDLLDKTSGMQHSLALGAGWETRRGRRLQSDFFAAMILAGVREKGLGAAIADSALGFEFGTSLRYFFTAKVFLALAVSYSQANISLQATESGLAGEYMLGGLRLGTRLGIRF